MSKFKSSFIKLFSAMFAVCCAFAIISMPKVNAQEIASFSVTQGASIRDSESDDVVGLQFTSSINGTWLSAHPSEKYTFGTLIYPTAKDVSFDENKTAIENIDLVDAVNIIHVQDKAVSVNQNFKASIVYDRQVVIDTIEAKGLDATEELVESTLRKLYNKDFTARAYAVVNGETIYADNSYSTSIYKVAVKTYAQGVRENNESCKTLALNYFESASVKNASVYVQDGGLLFDGAVQPEFSTNAIVMLDDIALKKDVDYTINQSGNIVIANSNSLLGQTKTYSIVDNGVLTICNVEFESLVITGIEVTALANAGEYKRTDDVSKYLKFNCVYSNGSKSENYSLNQGNITSISIDGSVATVNVAVTINNVKYQDQITLTVSEQPSTVAEILSATVDGEYMLNGVVVGFATTIDQNEVILADKNTSQYISVAKLGGGDIINGSYYVSGVDVGYEITIPVVLKQGNVGANANKLYAEYVGGSNTDVAVISKNNAVSLPNEKVVIDSTADLTALISGNNQYKVVTLRGEMNFVLDNKYEAYDFWFYDSEATKLSEIAVNGLIPTFSSVSSYFTTGKLFNQIVLDGKNLSCDFNNPYNIVKEITALYLGGNDTHAQFVILSENAVNSVEPTVTSKDFVAPIQLIYAVGDELNLDGCTLTYNYDISSSVTFNVTEDMIKNMPVIDTAGNYTITINDGSTDFTFEIQVLASRVKSIEICNMPTKSTYTHRDSFETLDLTGAKILVTYESGATEYVDITKEMFILEKSDEWKVGTVNYVLNYVGFEFNLPIVCENTALSIAEFKSATVGETYDVTGVIVGPMSSWAYGELLIKDKNSDELISVVHTGTVGAHDALNLDTTVHNIGDEIIFSAQLYQTATNSNTKGCRGRYHADAIDKETFVNSLMIVSTGNSVKFNLTSATSISSHSELNSFITSWSNTYKFVKFSGLKGRYKSTGYMIFFGDAYKAVNSSVPYIDMRTSKKYVSNAQSATYFNNYKGAEDTDCAEAKGDVYALYIGGNKTYFSFVILDADWFVLPTVSA